MLLLLEKLGWKLAALLGISCSFGLTPWPQLQVSTPMKAKLMLFVVLCV